MSNSQRKKEAAAKHNEQYAKSKAEYLIVNFLQTTPDKEFILIFGADMRHCFYDLGSATYLTYAQVERQPHLFNNTTHTIAVEMDKIKSAFVPFEHEGKTGLRLQNTPETWIKLYSARHPTRS